MFFHAKELTAAALSGWLLFSVCEVTKKSSKPSQHNLKIRIFKPNLLLMANRFANFVANFEFFYGSLPIDIV